MYREELGPNEGMIFPYNPPRMAGFWMKNVPIPLDIIFIGPDGRIINIAAQTTPFSEQSVYSEGAAAADPRTTGRTGGGTRASRRATSSNGSWPPPDPPIR